MGIRPFAVVLAATIANVACNLVTEACPAIARPAVLLDVRDSITDALAGRSAIITARDGAFADTAENAVGYDGPYGLAHHRPGTYTVTVSQVGYQPWSRTGVKVSRAECSVRTVSLKARLQP